MRRVEFHHINRPVAHFFAAALGLFKAFAALFRTDFSGFVGAYKRVVRIGFTMPEFFQRFPDVVEIEFDGIGGLLFYRAVSFLRSDAEKRRLGLFYLLVEM